MFEASFSEVIRVVLIILLIYFGLKIIIRWLGPLLLKYILKRVGKEFEKKFNGFNSSTGQKQKGDVTIEKKSKKGTKSNNEVGEYIDYEEID